MKKKTIAAVDRLTVSIVLLIVLIGSSANGQYELNQHTIDGGGGTSAGDSYVLTGTIGQPDAGRMASCEYHLSGGFWFAPGHMVDLDDFARFSSQWLESGDLEANLDGQGDVDILDFHIFVSYWLCYCPGDWPWY